MLGKIMTREENRDLILRHKEMAEITIRYYDDLYAISISLIEKYDVYNTVKDDFKISINIDSESDIVIEVDIKADGQYDNLSANSDTVVMPNNLIINKGGYETHIFNDVSDVQVFVQFNASCPLPPEDIEILKLIGAIVETVVPSKITKSVQCKV